MTLDKISMFHETNSLVVLVVLETKPRALHMLGKTSSTRLFPSCALLCVRVLLL